jgi:hypothetical protein
MGLGDTSTALNPFRKPANNNFVIGRYSKKNEMARATLGLDLSTELLRTGRSTLCRAAANGNSPVLPHQFVLHYTMLLRLAAPSLMLAVFLSIRLLIRPQLRKYRFP